jgi:hypothetical protein
MPLGGPEVGLNGAKPEAELELFARIAAERVRPWWWRWLAG